MALPHEKLEREVILLFSDKCINVCNTMTSDKQPDDPKAVIFC